MKFIFTCVTMLSVVAVINCVPGGSNLRSTQLRESYLEQLVELMVQEKQANDQEFALGEQETASLRAEQEEEKFDNKLDKDLSVECDEENGEALYRVKSKYSDKHRDRRWKWSCTKVSTVPTSDCSWTAYINQWDKPLLYHCPEDFVMSGISSVHDNHKEDRRWKIKCCRAEGYQTESCSLTPQYINNFRSEIDFEATSDSESSIGEIDEGRVFTGLYSFHRNDREDRRWKVFQCDYGMKTIMTTTPPDTSTLSTTEPTTENPPETDPPSPVLDLSVSCGFGNIAINRGIAQTFYPTRTGVIDKIAIWIEPGTSSLSASFALQIIEGTPDSTVLGESPTMVTTGGGPNMFYDFRFFSPITVNAGTQYSWKLLRKNQDNNVGGFNECPDTIPGNGYWLTTHSLSYTDYPFKLYIIE